MHFNRPENSHCLSHRRSSLFLSLSFKAVKIVCTVLHLSTGAAIKKRYSDIIKMTQTTGNQECHVDTMKKSLMIHRLFSSCISIEEFFRRVKEKSRCKIFVKPVRQRPILGEKIGLRSAALKRGPPQANPPSIEEKSRT